MFPLDEPTTRTVIRAIDIMQDEEGIDLPLRDHPLLRLQRLDAIQVEDVTGYTFAIGQLHRIDPPSYEARMILIVIDLRDRQTWEGPVTVYPVSFHDEINDVAEIGALLAKGHVRKFNTLIQQSLAKYACGWLAELHTAGYF